MAFNVGDKVRILVNGYQYECAGMQPGCETVVTAAPGYGMYSVRAVYDDLRSGDLGMHGDWLELVEDEVKMEYKVGDRVRIVERRNGHKFNIGELVKVTEVNDGSYRVDNEDDYWHVSDDEIEPAPSIIGKLSFDIDIPTQDMKEFADHCERAAAALERIKEMMA